MGFLFDKIVAILTSIVGILAIQQAPIPTPTPVTGIEIVSVASGSFTPAPSPLFTATPTPTPDIPKLIVELQELKEAIVNYTPEPTPTPQVVYITPTPTPEVVTPISLSFKGRSHSLWSADGVFDIPRSEIEHAPYLNFYIDFTPKISRVGTCVKTGDWEGTLDVVAQYHFEQRVQYSNTEHGGDFGKSYIYKIQCTFGDQKVSDELRVNLLQ